MAVIGIGRIPGDSQELLGKYDQVVAELGQIPPPGAISHYCVVTPEGITVANVFEDEDGLRAHYGRAEFRQALERAGVPRFTPEVRPVHNWRHAPVTAAVK
jgi:hypothetical protein